MVDRGMNRYEKGKIYQIVDVGFNKCYIGSTCESLSKRMERHRSKYKQYLKGKEHTKTRSFVLFDEYGVEHCKILWIEDYPCGSKKDLEAREGYYQQNTDCINKRIEGRTDKEYRDQNAEREKLRHQKYYQENKAKRKAYDEQHKDKKKLYNQNYREQNKERIRTQRQQYREKNKELIKERNKAYHEKNKEEINKKLREK